MVHAPDSTELPISPCVEGIAVVVAYADRRKPLGVCLTNLLLPDSWMQWSLTGLRRAGRIISDNDFRKKERHSICIALQYCGVLGKRDE
jgi:hypothetical protein